MPPEFSPAKSTNLNRRAFIGTAAALTTSAASYGRIIGANDRIRMGAIGTGERCQYLLSLFNKAGGNDVVAVCDVYEPHRQEAKTKYGPAAIEYGDYRQVLDNPAIDAVVIGTPNHWHVPILTAAVAAGKDAYCEKPVTHKIHEGPSLITAVRNSKRVVQTGTQQRSWPHYIEAKQLVDEGRLGQITLVRTYWYQNYQIAANRPRPPIDTSKLNWKQFLGSAPERPFNQDQYEFWRWYWDFGGGAMTDLFVHWVDVAQWYLNNDSPDRATATGLKATFKQRDCPDTMGASYAYNGFVVDWDCAMIGNVEDGGLMFRGTKAALWLHRSGFRLFDEVTGPFSETLRAEDALMLERSTHDGTFDHVQNFLDCVRSRKTPNAPVEIGVAAARTGHIGNLALRGNGLWTAQNRETSRAT